ncbi:MAG TPA: divalent-cation tolerance protein CutA [Pontiella sp.]|nr:divalent-cation tolerance protein CutA [Pontiella sp.]
METYTVYVTARDEAEAKKIARAVVDERLAACANVLGRIDAVYRWQGSVCEENEVALILKTSARRTSELIDRIKELHSYECPCVVCLPIADGNRDYLTWIAAETDRD